MIEMIRWMRALAARVLHDSLLPLIDTAPSEAEIRDRCRQALDAHAEVFADGWYQPPPDGIIVAAADPPFYDRVHQPSYRPLEAWPSTLRTVGRDSLLYIYASPVHRETGIIGDVGISLYRGSDRALREHLRRVYSVTLEIIDGIESGMTLGEVARFADEITKRAGLENQVHSVSDASGVNIGHTIPWSGRSISPTDRMVLENGSASERAGLVSNARRFVNPLESSQLVDFEAFTIEPRLSAPGLPTVGFHFVVGFESGKKRVITEFEPLVDLFEMRDLLSG